MTDKKLCSLMNKVIKSVLIHKNLLKLLEEEYIMRYGFNPSEIDDDFFIDTFHYGGGKNSITVEELDNSAKLHINISGYRNHI